MTPGVEETTLDGINMRYLEKIQNLMKSGKFTFSPARRIQIPKPGKKKTRPLTIASPRDKIVQKAIQIVLEQSFEPEFLDCSHGFRPNRGTHTAIKQLDAKFQSVKYVIEADLSKAFDSIPHDKLMKIIGRVIKCDKTLKLIKSGLKTGFIKRDKLIDDLTIGTPQGSILSPLLCNIYFHQLDLFMKKLMERHNKGQKRALNKTYVSLQNKVKYMRRKGQYITNEQGYKLLLRTLTKTPSRNHNDSLTRVHYIRYADDFVVGIEGSYSKTLVILDEVRCFLSEIGLTLNESKTKITKFNTDHIEFLGYKVMSPYIEGIEKPMETYREVNSNRLVTRRKKIRVRIFMDYDKVIKKIITKGLIRKRTFPTSNYQLTLRGTFQGNLIQLDHADILRYFNAVIREIYNYYSFVGNMRQLARVMWLIEESCCMTLMRKFKLKSMRAAYRKFGKDLGCTIKDKNGQPRLVILGRPNDYKSTDIKDLGDTISPLKTLSEVWNSKFTKTNLFAKCVICETEKDIEMHHVRKIRDLKNPQTMGKDFLIRQMMAINRKQIPICKEHHLKYHNGTLTETELKEFRKTASRKQKLSITKKGTKPTITRTTKEIIQAKDTATLYKERDEKFREYLNSTISEFDLIPKPSKTDKD